MKAAGNDFVHRGIGSVNYDSFLDGVVSVVAHLYLLAVPTDFQVVVYRWEIGEEVWEDRW